jgi:hypothetical protein
MKDDNCIEISDGSDTDKHKAFENVSDIEIVGNAPT